MNLDAKNAERVVADIVRTFILSLQGNERFKLPDNAIVLIFSPREVEPSTSEMPTSLVAVGKPVFDEVKRILEERAFVERSDLPPVLRQFAFKRPWFDIAFESADDRILFHVNRIHDVREA